MNLVHAIQRLDALGVDMGMVGDDLILTGDIAALPPDLRATLVEAKPHLLREMESLRAPVAQPWGKGASCCFYPASHGQQRLAFLDAYYRSSSAYIVSASIFFRGMVDLERLIASLKTVATMQDGIYTYLARTEACEFSVVDRNLPIDIPVIDLIDHPDHAAELERLRETISTTPFDLTHPPLWRWALVRNGPDEVELIVAIHHFISDGWSLAAAFRQVARAYRGGAALAATALRTAPYQQFARHQRARLAQPNAPQALADAQAALAGCRLASDRFNGKPRPVLKSDRARRVAFSLQPEQAADLRALAARLSLTISSVLAAAYALAIHRFTEGDRFAIGIAASNRPHARFEDTFGFFVNWVAVPVDCGEVGGFSAFVRRFHHNKLAAIDRVFIPFEEVAKLSGAERQQFLHPVFQYMFVSHVPARGVALPGLDVTLLPLPNGGAKLDLTMFLTDSRDAIAVEGEGDLFLELEYNAELFDEPTITRFVKVYRAIVAAAASDPDKSLMVIAGRAPSIVHGPTSPTADTILAPFEAIARRFPEHVALECAGQSWTYGDLRGRAAQIAGQLGAERRVGQIIGILALRGFDLIAGLLGVLAAGAAFTTLDPGAPRERNRRICSDARPAMLLYSRNLACDAAALAGDAATAPIEDYGVSLGKTEMLRRTPVLPDDPAYLLYTSGSTGIPKGALIPHGALANFATWMGAALEQSEADRVIAKTPVSFDAFLRETLASLCQGSRIVAVPDVDALDVEALVSTIQDRDVTILHATPTIHGALLEAAARRGGEALGSLTRVMCGGETLSPVLAARHFELLPRCRLFNVYGPTECTVDVMCREISRADGLAVTLGRPINNCTIMIVDADLRAVDDGKVGEIVIVGLPVGLGYRGGTGEGGPFLARCPGTGATRAYRTGDRGRLMPSGEIEYCGRADRQLKVRGMRIEPGEIEAAIETHPHVSKAIALTLPGGGGEPILAVAVQLRPAAPDDDDAFAARLQSHLASRLPPAMLPRFFVRVDDFPRTAHGKFDDKALLRMMEARAASLAGTGHAAIEENLTRVEAEIVAFASALLARSDIGRNDNFFALGGHSLSAIRLLNQVNKRFNTTLTVKDLFAEPTVAALAMAIASSPAPVAAATPAIQPIRRRRRAAS